MLQPGGTGAIGYLWPWGDALRLAGAFVETRDVALVGARVDDIRVPRVGRDVAAFASANRIPVGAVNPAGIAHAGGGHGGVVLLRAVDVVGEAVVRDDVVELRGGLVVLARPGFSAVHRDGGAAVVPVDHAPRVGGVDPQGVMVAVRHHQQGELLPAVGGAVGSGIEHIDRVGIRRVSDDVRVIPGALAEAVVVVDAAPFFAAIVGAVQTPLLGFDQRVDPVRVRRRNGNADTPQQPLGQPVAFQALPRRAAVAGAVKPAARPAACQAPGTARGFPERREQHVRIGAVEGDVNPAASLVLVEDLFPRLAAVGGAEDAALGVRPVGVAQRGHEDDLRVARMHQDAADVARVAEPEMLPDLAAIGGLVNPVAE